jgi:hypothetical protein
VSLIGGDEERVRTYMGDNIKDDKASESLDGDLDLAKSDTDDVVGGIAVGRNFTTGRNAAKGQNTAKGRDMAKGSDTTRGAG